jgi:chorismate mutase
MDELRAKVTFIDQEILGLIKKRLEYARSLGEVKLIEGLPIKDFSQESIVLERFSKWAQQNNECHLMAQELAHLLMRWAIQVQVNQSPNLDPNRDL